MSQLNSISLRQRNKCGRQRYCYSGGSVQKMFPFSLKVQLTPAVSQEFQCCVQEQVGTMKSVMAARACDPDSLRRVEGQWGAALLDASATAHVKATQLGQVKEYHTQLRAIQAFLQVLHSEKEKVNL